MTRKKKSRKPSIDPIRRLSKEEKQKIAELRDKKPKKQTGKKPGNRQQEAMNKTKSSKQSSGERDPRIGSKKPIDLGVPAIKTAAKPKKSSDNQLRVAPIKVLASAASLTLAEQIDAIENDELLQEILAKQEQDIELTEHEVNHYNQLMDQHEALSEQLAEQNPELSEHDENELDDDSLWDKLDNNYFDQE